MGASVTHRRANRGHGGRGIAGLVTRTDGAHSPLGADPEAVLDHAFDTWSDCPGAIEERSHVEYRRATPSGPTNGAPCLSSWSPGCSPTTVMTAGTGPSAKTVWVARR